MDVLKEALALAQYEVMRANEKLEVIEKIIEAREQGDDVVAAMKKQMSSKGNADDEEGGKKKKRKYPPKFDEDGNQIKRAISGYQLYIKNTLDKTDEDHKDFAKCAAIWKELSEDEKAKWNEKAKAEPPTIIAPATPGFEKVVEKETEKDNDDSEPVVSEKKKKKKKDKKEKKDKKARKESMGSQSNASSDFEK